MTIWKIIWFNLLNFYYSIWFWTELSYPFCGQECTISKSRLYVSELKGEVKHVFQHIKEFPCEFDQSPRYCSIWDHGCSKKAKKFELIPIPHLLTAAEYTPLCWYYYYEQDRCCVVINVGPRKMRVSVVHKVWGVLYVRWNKTLSVSHFQ